MLDLNSYQDLEDYEVTYNAYCDEDDEDGLDLVELEPILEVAQMTEHEVKTLASLGNWLQSHNEAERLRREYEIKYGEKLEFNYDSI